MALFWFLAGVLVGSSVLLMRREEPEGYRPSPVEHEIARLMEPDDLTVAAYLYKGEGLVGYQVEEGRPS
jgi:hypothetical protein